MSERSADVSEQRADAAEVLRTMFVDLDDARATAEALLVRGDDPIVHSYAHQVLGIARREAGDLPAAFDHLRTAMDLAERVGDHGRRADAQATFGATLAVAGSSREGVAHMDEAIGVLEGEVLARALTRRGWVYVTLLGRFVEGAEDMEEAAQLFAANGDVVWQARALNLLGYARLFLGDLDTADRHFEHAGRLYAHLGDHNDRAVTVQNRGYAAYLRGDLPRTFALLNDAASVLVSADMWVADLVVDRCTAYLAAGLLPEATATIEGALAEHTWGAREHAELLSTQAQIALAAGDDEQAELSASEAVRVLEEQGRDWFAARAELIALTARRARASDSPPALHAAAAALVEKSRRLRLPEHTQTLLLAAAIAEDHDPAGADALLQEAEEATRHDAALTRALGWLATARRAAAHGRSAVALDACEHGLTAVDEHQSLLGSSELRALATERGRDLAGLALTTALEDGTPADVLHWIERWRSTGTAGTAHLPPGGAAGSDISRDLVALRSQRQQADAARDAGQPTEPFDRSIAELEHRIRERHLLRSGATPAAPSTRSDVAHLLDTLTAHDTTLVELFTTDRGLQALVAHRGHVQLSHVGPLDSAIQAQTFAHFVLTRAGRGEPARLEQAGTRLQTALLGDLVVPGDGPVLVSAPNQLQRVPWTLLPALGGRAVSTAPSAHTWLRAAAQRPAGDARTFIVGPGLASGGAEVDAVRPDDPTATYLTGGDATVEASLRAMDGAALVHVAAHGTFRKDNPLFSRIDLVDGPLMVHDLEHLTHPPHRVVLSACETGDMQPVGADELLGLSVTLLSMGSAGVVSSLVKVHDQATAEVMTHAHHALRRGLDGASAMLHARHQVSGDPLLAATAVSFTAFGT